MPLFGLGDAISDKQAQIDQIQADIIAANTLRARYISSPPPGHGGVSASDFAAAAVKIANQTSNLKKAKDELIALMAAVVPSSGTTPGSGSTPINYGIDEIPSYLKYGILAVGGFLIYKMFFRKKAA